MVTGRLGDLEMGRTGIMENDKNRSDIEI